MPNPRTWLSSVEVCSAAWRAGGLVAMAAGFFSISNGLGFGFTVTGSIVFGSTFFFLFLLRETAVRWEHIREIGGCCLFWVPTVDNKHKYGTGTCVWGKPTRVCLCDLQTDSEVRFPQEEAQVGKSHSVQQGCQRQPGPPYSPNSRASSWRKPLWTQWTMDHYSILASTEGKG